MDPQRRPGSEPRRGADDRFDEALGRVARSFVTERLPHRVLDPAVGVSLGLPTTDDGDLDGSERGGSGRADRRVPGFALVGAAVIVLLLAAATFAPTLLLPGGSQATLAPTTSAAPSLTPAFRTTEQIRADLVLLGYACTDGTDDVPTEQGADAARESAVCTAPDDVGPLVAAVTVGESADGRVVEVKATAEIVGFDIPASRRSVAATLAKAVAVVVPQGLGNAVATWVENNAPVVERKGIVSVELRGYALHLERSVEGGYTLLVVPVRPA